MTIRSIISTCLAGLCFLAASQANAGDLFTLTPSLPSGQPVGTAITWIVSGDAGAPVDVRMLMRREGRPLRVRYDYSSKRQFPWTPFDEGTYEVIVYIRDPVNPAEVSQLSAQFVITPIVSTTPRVVQTRNPLVAHYSAPACMAGNRMEVQFRATTGGIAYKTPRKACNPAQTMNFLLGGMRGSTTYRVQHFVVDAKGTVVRTGTPLNFATGVPTIELPAVSVRVPAGPDTSLAESLLVASPTPGNGNPVAVNSRGEYVWYYQSPDPTEPAWFLIRMSPGGRMLMIAPDEAGGDRFRMREIDLAGNALRETTARRLDEQYKAIGGTAFAATIHHEVRELPNGQTVVLMDSERLFEDVQGPGEVNVIGDIVLGLDSNWQVIWGWDSYEHMDVTRPATLGEICVSEGPGCPILYLSEEANDWLHSNAIAYSPNDGNLVISMRHQDWNVKIDYQDGQGSGEVLWRMGVDGDFGVVSEDPFPWFTHAHDPNFIGDGSQIVIYDNSVAHPDCLALIHCESRGQVYQLDETNMTAELVVNAPLQNHAFAIGSAQQLANGNYSFNSGLVDAMPLTHADETTPDGDIVFSLQIDTQVYRSFRVRSMYLPPNRL